jgi:hypothetical protein
MESEIDKRAPAKGDAAATREGDDPPARRVTARDTTTRSFVIQISPDSCGASQSFAGRVQHLATSDGGNFDSLEGMAAIVRRVLLRAEDSVD